MSELKKQIIDAAKLLACTPESESYGTPEVMRYKIHALIEACENLDRERTEIIKWISVADDMPDDSIDVLVFGNQDPLWPVSSVWPGYWDSAEECWRTSNGSEVEQVTHWAKMPEGPKVTA